MLANLTSSCVIGIKGYPITVEVDISNGLPAFTTVGLPDGSVRESKDRVKSAIKNSGYQFPSKRITVNLAPADLRKEGTAFDLPIAIGLLIASGIVPQQRVKNIIIVGELSLDGSVRAVPGILSMALGAQDNGFDAIIVSADDSVIASLARKIRVVPVSHLHEVVEWLSGVSEIKPIESPPLQCKNDYSIGFENINGQRAIKRALEVAAAGNHNVLLSGEPGTGKTLLARTVPTIMPELNYEEMVETTPTRRR